MASSVNLSKGDAMGVSDGNLQLSTLFGGTSLDCPRELSHPADVAPS
jgi:hypothetical protein